MLIYLSSGKIVGENMVGQLNIHRMKEEKIRMDCAKYNCSFLKKYRDYAYSLKFEEEPKYGYLRHLLAKNIMDQN